MAEKLVQNIADIARICKVSKSTVSRALNDSPLISEETKERVRAVASEHHFQINIPARRLSTQRSRTIAFTVCSQSDLFLLEIMGAISSTLATYHYDLLMANVDPRDDNWPHLYLDTGRVDGFILLTSTRKKYHVKTLVEMQAPFIVWGPPLPNYRYSSVISDNFAGGRLATQHLLKTGRRRIGFIGGPADEFECQCRFDGYASALEAQGLTLDPDLVMYGDWSHESGTELTRRLLEGVPDLDAIFATSDLMAAAAINVLNESGRRVPKDVAVVGYDNLSIARYISPALTTVSQNIPLVGKLLAQNLIQRIETGVVTNVTIPAELIVRNST